MKKNLLLLLLIFAGQKIFAQSLSVNTDGSTANASAILDVKSTTKGLLIPRLTKPQKYAVVAPANGLLIYQTGPDSIGFYYYQNSRWNWLTDNNKSDSTYWGLHGNNNTTPPSSVNNAAINFATDTYLGTFDAKDVSLVAGGNELLRLKQFATGGRLGLSNRNPEYSLDLRITEIATETQIQGLRIIPNSLFDLNNADNKNKGLVIGSNSNNANESTIWNHGNNINGAIRMGLDFFDNNIQPAFNITGWGQGIYQRNPKYLLDIHSLSQFVAANAPATNKNGIRITYQNQGTSNTLDNGLLLGVGINNNVYKSYIWNYADGTGFNSPDKAIYFGVGGDMDLANQLATMELQDGKITMGHITDPNFFFPSTLNIQTNYVSSVAKNGISIMKHLVNGQESAYFGTDINDNLNMYKFGGNSIYLGNPASDLVTISNNNSVGIGTLLPLARLHVKDSSVLFSAAGNIPATPNDVPVSGAGRRMMWYPEKAAFRVGSVTGTQWDGDSIGVYSFAGGYNTKASGPLSLATGVSTTASGYASIAMGQNTTASGYNSTSFGINSIASGTTATTMGTNTIAKSDNSLVIGMWNDSSSNSLFEIGNGDNFARRNAMTVLTNGNVGIGIKNPNALLQFANTIANRKLVLYETANNNNQYYGLGINGATLRYQVDDVAANHVFYAAASAAGSNELFRIKGNGDIGVGASSPFAYGHGGTNRIIELKNSAAAGTNVQSHLILSTTGNAGSLGGITWAATGLAGEQRTGFIGNIYETASATRLVFYARSGAGVLAEKFNIQSNGNAVLQGTLTQLSDSRFKANIQQLDNSLQKIQKLNGYTYNWIDESRDKDLQIGLLAQEVQKIYPQLVKQNENGDLSVNYMGLIPVLLEGMKEQQKQLDEQRKLIDELIKSSK